MTNLTTRILTYAIATGISLFSGCKDVRTELSDVLHEEATIVTKLYSPPRHETEVGVKAVNFTGRGAGSISMDYGGNVGIGIGSGLQISSVEVPENYGVVFRCAHGSFTSQGSDPRHKDLHNRLKEGQAVDVTYREIYRILYDDQDGDGKKEVVQRALVGLDFLDAQPK